MAGNQLLRPTSAPIATQTGEHFGAALVAADLEGSTADDLAIGVPEYDPSSSESEVGAVEVAMGSTDGLGSSFRSFAQSGGGTGDRYGVALAAADFGRGPDGKGTPGKADLAIGIPGSPAGGSPGSNAGAVQVRYLFSGGSESQLLDESDLSRTIESGDYFGASLAAANFGKGGGADLAVGAPFENIESPAPTKFDAGIVGVFYSHNGFLQRDNPATPQEETNAWDQGNAGIGNVEDGDRFGASLTAANFGNGSTADLAAGAPGEDLALGGGQSSDNAGAVGVIYGSDTGLGSAGSQGLTASSVNPAKESGAAFGTSLGAANFGKGGPADPAVGAPFSSLFDGYGAVLYGAANGLQPGDPTDVWAQGRSGLKDQGEEGDRFGEALAPRDGGTGALGPVS